MRWPWRPESPEAVHPSREAFHPSREAATHNSCGREPTEGVSPQTASARREGGLAPRRKDAKNGNEMALAPPSREAVHPSREAATRNSCGREPAEGVSPQWTPSGRSGRVRQGVSTPHTSPLTPHTSYPHHRYRRSGSRQTTGPTESPIRNLRQNQLSLLAATVWPVCRPIVGLCW